MAVGVESYVPYRAAGSGWKAALAYQLVCCLAWDWGVAAMPFTPGDLKRAFAGRLKATKGDVIEAMGQKLVSFAAQLEGIAKGHHEHVADAAGHAYLALEEVYKVRGMLGM
jgi:Holliday junction resolvasome RuvABC endonuclease subunit